MKPRTGRLAAQRPPAVPHPSQHSGHPPWGEQHGAPSTRGHPVDMEPGRSLVNGSPHRQGQTPRAGGAAPHPMQSAPGRTRTTGAGLASAGAASETALDRTGSGPDRLRTGRRWPRSQRRPPAAGPPPRATSDSKSTIMFKQTKILDAQNYSRVH